MTDNLDWMEYTRSFGSSVEIPQHTHEALIRYFVHGMEPGSFLTAMLAGDLYAAAFKADHINKGTMGHIAVWIVHHAPHNSYGNYDIVKTWCNDPTVRADFEKKVMWHQLNTAHVPKVYDF